MAELKDMISAEVERRVTTELQKLGSVLVSDMNAMLRNASDEIERLGKRMKNMEELLQNKTSLQSGIQMPMENNIEMLTTATEKHSDDRQPMSDTSYVQNQSGKTEQKPAKGATNEEGGWTVVKSKNAKKRKAFASGAVLIGGDNVRRIGAAAREEFRFEENVIFSSAEEATSGDVSQRLPSTIRKTNAEAVDIVLHFGENDILDSEADNVLEGFAHVISVAKRQPNTRDVFVCSVVERRDAGRLTTDTARQVNDQLGSLCATYGARYLDLRARLNECMHSGVNKTRVQYTWEGARNVSQEILSEVQGFLD